ncbi:MAG: hypothetical protein AAF581_10420 [Planctomycetota bacterium]
MTVRPIILAVSAPVLSIGSSAVFMCVCGHVDHLALPGNLGGVILSWCAVALKKQPTLAERLGYWLSVGVTTALLFNNLLDVLWLGHEPVF